MLSTFREKHSQELKLVQKDIRNQLFSNIIPFWEERIIDPEYGGYFTCFDRKGNQTSDLKPGWFVGRTLNTFAGLIRNYGPNARWEEIAEHGVAFLKPPFYAGNGRFNYLLSREGKVLEGTSSVFTDHFVLGGLYEYIRATGKTEHIDFAKALSDDLFKNVKDKNVLHNLGVREGFQKSAVNFITMHVAQESSYIFGEKYLPIAKEYAQNVLYTFPSDEYEAVFENVSITGQPVLEGDGRLIDPGHTFEALWFVMEQGEILQTKEYNQRAATLLDWTWERCYDREYGGFYQFVDVEHHVPEKEFLSNTYVDIPVAWDAKIWWVQAEALIAYAKSALVNENEAHYRHFLEMYQYIKDFFVDKDHPEWYTFLNRDGTVLSDEKGTQLKGPYHVPRALYKVDSMIKEYLQ